MSGSRPKAEDVRCGGWIVASYKAFACYDVEDAVFDPYEATLLAGKAAELLSSIRALGKIDGKKFDVYRKIARLKPRDGIAVIADLESLGGVAVDWDTSNAEKQITGIQSLCSTKAEVFETTAKFFRSRNPSRTAEASLQVLDMTLHMPARESDVLTHLHGCKIDDGTAKIAIRDLVTFQLVNRTQETENGESLIYNPYSFSKNASDIYKALNSLSAKAKEQAMAILEHVKNHPGVPFPPHLDSKVIALLAKTGIVDVSGVKVKGGATNREFPTAPYVWGALSTAVGGLQLSSDLIDDSKLLLNSLRYGEYYSRSNRGRIQDPAVLINALIQRGQVGPATAIGEDYPLPLARGIVGIAESRMYPGRYFMELRKNDVAEAAAAEPSHRRRPAQTPRRCSQWGSPRSAVRKAALRSGRWREDLTVGPFSNLLFLGSGGLFFVLDCHKLSKLWCNAARVNRRLAGAWHGPYVGHRPNHAANVVVHNGITANGLGRGSIEVRLALGECGNQRALRPALGGQHLRCLGHVREVAGEGVEASSEGCEDFFYLRIFLLARERLEIFRQCAMVLGERAVVAFQVRLNAWHVRPLLQQRQT